MTLEGVIIMAVVIGGLMVLGFVRAKIEKINRFKEARQAFAQMQKTSLTLPSGREIPQDEDIKRFLKRDFQAYTPEDLSWIVNYIGHKMSDFEELSDEYKQWGIAYTEASRALHKW